MACYYPRILNIKGDQIKVPCGDCIGCRLEYSRQWGIRCFHESTLYEKNSFLTLTYNQKNLPNDQSISKETLQKFIRRLRKQLYPKLIRYFGCGEYGEKLGRPHYHLILFNHDFDDKEIHEYGQVDYDARSDSVGFKKGKYPKYKSKTLENIWGKGFCTIGEVSFESACYVSRYITKKINGPLEKSHYKGKLPEFCLMSKRPGIGKTWIMENFNEIYPKDYFTINGKKCRPIKYYDKCFQRYCADSGQYMLWDQIKYERSKKVKNEDSMRNHQKAGFRKIATKPLIRKLENDIKS